MPAPPPGARPSMDASGVPFTHRDHRISRDLLRATVGVLLAIGALGAAVLLLPDRWARVAAVIGLMATGGVFLLWADRAVAQYRHDLTAAAVELPGAGWARAEGSWDIGLHPRTVTGTSHSPHSRRPAPRPPERPEETARLPR